jgi:hypothetical protein
VRINICACLNRKHSHLLGPPVRFKNRILHFTSVQCFLGFLFVKLACLVPLGDVSLPRFGFIDFFKVFLTLVVVTGNAGGGYSSEARAAQETRRFC